MGKLAFKKKKWYLTRLDIDSDPFVFNDFPVIVGRGNEADVFLDDSSVSAVHAQFNATDDGLILHDLDSTNGTFVGSHRISTLPILPRKEGNLIVSFGAIECEIGYGAPPERGKNTTKDADAVWYYAHEGKQHGPLTSAEVFTAVDAGKLVKTDEVWRTDDDLRVKAGEVKGLFEEPLSAEAAIVDDAPNASMSSHGYGSVTCPHCWYRFNPEQALSIASHPDLLGDPVLGKEDPQRFLPTRFTPEGLALDARGMRCTDIACPRCHLRLPTLALSLPPVFLSIVGAPGSGKSYFLASSIWRLRTILPSVFGLSFNDADGLVNQWLNDYEEKLFFQSEATRIQPIVKTDETAAHVYKNVTIDGVQMLLPLPCMFGMAPGSSFASSDSAGKKCLVLYDNAGEHFQVGHDSIVRPGTQHLIHSEGILFLFDPLADPRFRMFLRQRAEVDIGKAAAVHRQDVLLVEMISRIRKHMGLTEGDFYEKPLVMCVSKADVFGGIIDFDGDPWTEDPATGGNAIDLNKVARVSYQMRQLLIQYVPEVVTTVEGFARRVVYMPISALGHHPNEEGVDPTQINSRWVEVPILYLLAKTGFLPSVGPDLRPAAERDVQQKGHLLRFASEETGRTHEVPWHYSGYELRCDKSGKSFRVPVVDDAPTI